MVTLWEPTVTVLIVGSVGAVYGVYEYEDVVGPVPAELEALTLKVYAVPLVNPETVPLSDEEPVVVRVDQVVPLSPV